MGRCTPYALHINIPYTTNHQKGTPKKHKIASSDSPAKIKLLNPSISILIHNFSILNKCKQSRKLSTTVTGRRKNKLQEPKYVHQPPHETRNPTDTLIPSNKRCITYAKYTYRKNMLLEVLYHTRVIKRFMIFYPRNSTYLMKTLAVDIV